GVFEVAASRTRIFARRATAANIPLEFLAGAPVGHLLRLHDRDEAGPLWNALDVQREADRVLLSRYAPVGVVIDESMTVLQFRGRTSAYLEPAPGMASLDLLKMLREGLLAEVRTAINRARAENVGVVHDGLTLIDGDRRRPVRVEVIPFRVPPGGVRCLLVLFSDGPRPAEAAPAGGPPPAESPAAVGEQQVAQLQQELAALREYLQSVIEEQ